MTKQKNENKSDLREEKESQLSLISDEEKGKPDKSDFWRKIKKRKRVKQN